MKTFTALAVLAAGAELASATFFNSNKFNCPANTNNQCNPQQSSGFDWTSLDLGSFQNYGEFNFNGWQCADSFGSGRKRDLLTGRTFKDKCITGRASHDKSKCPSFGCGKSPSVKDFSVVEFEISVEFDCELEFHFEMPDKSLCKQKTYCSKGGSVVKNKQCGGAVNVHVVYPVQTMGPGTSKNGCDVGVHSMSFDCNSASATKVTTKSVQTQPATTQATITSVPAITTKPASISVPATTSKPAAVETSKSSVSQPEDSDSTSGVVVTASSSSVSVPDITSTVIVPETTSTAIVPVTTPLISTSTGNTFVFTNSTTTNVLVQSSSTAEGSFTTSVPAIPTPLNPGSPVTPLNPGSPVTPPASEDTPSLPPIPLTPANCPDVLPSCLNTWLFTEGCTSNTDSACYCPSSAFVQNVFDCLSAHAADDDEIASAQQYFQGICAPHIGENPAIVTGATTALVTTATPAATSVPVTTITIMTTLVVPCIETTGISSGSTIPGTSITTLLSTYLTVPQVIFQTVSSSYALVAGTPAPVPAATTIPLPSASTLSVSRTGSIPTQTPVPFTGAASQLPLGLSAVFGAFVVAVFAL